MCTMCLYSYKTAAERNSLWVYRFRVKVQNVWGVIDTWGLDLRKRGALPMFYSISY